MCKLSRNRAKTSVFCKFLPDYDVYEDHPITSPSIDSGEAEVIASIVRRFVISVNGKYPKTTLHHFQFRKDDRSVVFGVVLEKHAVIDGHVCDAFLLIHLPLVGENNGAVDAIFFCFNEFA